MKCIAPLLNLTGLHYAASMQLSYSEAISSDIILCKVKTKGGAQWPLISF